MGNIDSSEIMTIEVSFKELLFVSSFSGPPLSIEKKIFSFLWVHKILYTTAGVMKTVPSVCVHSPSDIIYLIRG